MNDHDIELSEDAAQEIIRRIRESGHMAYLMPADPDDTASRPTVTIPDLEE